MSTRPVVYIAAPYGAPTRALIGWNIARACALATLAIREGLAPVVVHPSIPVIYGEEETPGARAVGLEVDTAIVAMIARSLTGRLWILETDAGELTPGVLQEYRTWRTARGLDHVERRATWEGYAQSFRAARLLELHAALVEPGRFLHTPELVGQEAAHGTR